MAQKSFYGNGPDHLFSNPSNWTPNGVPQSGDVAFISMATVLATGPLPFGISIDVSTRAGMARYGHLTLQDATVPTGTTVSAFTIFDTYDGLLPSSLEFAGTVVNAGTMILSGGTQTVQLPTGATLTNTGTIDVNGAAPQFSAVDANLSIVNDGLIRIVNASAQTGQLAVFGPAITGTGTISVSLHAALEFGGAVGAQTLQFAGGVNAGSAVQIDQPSAFAATIGGFVLGDTLALANTAMTSLAYTPTGTGSGTLQLFAAAAAPVASLSFAGTYTTASFGLSQSGSSLLITTSVTDPATGSTTAPVSTGIYRFFDTRDGTHFYTASVAERDTVLVSRPDLVQETSGFGALLQASATTKPVYRFFDATHGTHFFTASVTERDTVAATRSDLTFEPSATFLEHTTAQPGDVPVYRFFSTTDGTHLYTGSDTERTGLTTAGSPTYRPDLVSEGIGFYAPANTVA